MAQLGKRYEPDESDFHLEQMTELEEIKEMETSLEDEKKQKLLVSINNIKSMSIGLVDYSKIKHYKFWRCQCLHACLLF